MQLEDRRTMGEISYEEPTRHKAQFVAELSMFLGYLKLAVLSAWTPRFCVHAFNLFNPTFKLVDGVSGYQTIRG